MGSLAPVPDEALWVCGVVAAVSWSPAPADPVEVAWEPVAAAASDAGDVEPGTSADPVSDAAASAVSVGELGVARDPDWPAGAVPEEVVVVVVRAMGDATASVTAAAVTAAGGVVTTACGAATGAELTVVCVDTELTVVVVVVVVGPVELTGWLGAGEDTIGCDGVGLADDEVMPLLEVEGSAGVVLALELELGSEELVVVVLGEVELAESDAAVGVLGVAVVASVAAGVSGVDVAGVVEAAGVVDAAGVDASVEEVSVAGVEVSGPCSISRCERTSGATCPDELAAGVVDGAGETAGGVGGTAGGAGTVGSVGIGGAVFTTTGALANAWASPLAAGEVGAPEFFFGAAGGDSE